MSHEFSKHETLSLSNVNLVAPKQSVISFATVYGVDSGSKLRDLERVMTPNKNEREATAARPFKLRGYVTVKSIVGKGIEPQPQNRVTL